MQPAEQVHDVVIGITTGDWKNGHFYTPSMQHLAVNKIQGKFILNKTLLFQHLYQVYSN